MSSKNHQNLPTLLTIVLFLLAICPQQSTQSTAESEYSTVTGTCIYGYSQNMYTCALSDATILNPTDVLEIVGDHLTGHTDANVQAVTHQRSTIRFFNGEILRKFVNLRSIQIVEQGLREFGANAFAVCPNLEELLTAIDDQLTALPPQMLGNCGNLRSLNIVLHNITDIPENLFGQTRNLEVFSITNNHLTSLPVNLLQNMVNLRNFNVANNQIRELNPSLLRNAVNLEDFIISNNRFENPQNIMNVLNGRSNLRRMLLINNNFFNFDFRLFAQFQSLVEITIGSTSGPQLTGISWQSLPGTLTSLRVERIGEEIPGTAFSQLANLNSLTLSGAGISSLHRDTFRSLTRMTLLTITNTNIRILPGDLFTSQANLVNLNLGNNRIEELPVGIFTPLVNIGLNSNIFGLRMGSNQIQRLNANSFGQHPHLTYIDFFQNRINEIERGLFSRFHQNLAYANFRLNVCITRTFFDGINLDADDSLTLCFNNWAGITTVTPPTTTTTTTTGETPTTTPGGCGHNFKKFEIFLIFFVGFVIFLINFVK